MTKEEKLRLAQNDPEAMERLAAQEAAENAAGVPAQTKVAIAEEGELPTQPTLEQKVQTAQINNKVKNPHIKTKQELEQDKTPLEKLLEQSNALREKASEDIKTAKEDDKKRNLYANLAKAIGKLGAAEIQRKAGVDAGLTAFTPVKVSDSTKDIRTDRDLMLKQLQDQYKMIQSEKVKDNKITPYQKAQLEDKKEDRKLKEKLAKLTAKSKVESNGIKLTKGQEKADSEYAKKLIEWNAAGGSSNFVENAKIFNEAIEDLSSSGGKGPETDTGFWAGARSKLSPGYRTEADLVETRVRKALNAMLRATLGAQFTEAEGERIFSQTFDKSAPNENNIANMRTELDKLKGQARNMEAMAEVYEREGTIKNYKTPSVNTDGEVNEVRRKTKDGRSAIFNADTKEFIRYE